MALDESNRADLHEFQTSEIFQRFVLRLKPKEQKQYVVVENKENSRSYTKRYLTHKDVTMFSQQKLLSDKLQKEMYEYVSLKAKIEYVRKHTFDRDRLGVMLAQKYISKDFHKALKKYYKLLDEEAELRKKIDGLKSDLQEVLSDEKRLRENIKILSAESSSLRKKWVLGRGNGSVF